MFAIQAANKLLTSVLILSVSRDNQREKNLFCLHIFTNLTTVKPDDNDQK